MAELRVEKHPDKTFIGRISQGLGVAQKTVERMVDKVSRLYEQGADELRIEAYLKRWWQWVRSGVDGVLMAREGAHLLSLSAPSRFLSVGLVRY